MNVNDFFPWQRMNGPTISVNVYLGLLVTPTLIAHRIIGSSDGVWDEITKIIFWYCPLAHFSEINSKKVKKKKSEWLRALNEVRREHFRHSEFGFPDGATWDSILKFGNSPIPDFDDEDLPVVFLEEVE